MCQRPPRALQSHSERRRHLLLRGFSLQGREFQRALSPRSLLAGGRATALQCGYRGDSQGTRPDAAPQVIPPRDNTGVGSFKEYDSNRKHEAASSAVSDSLQSSPTVTQVNGRLKEEPHEAPTIALYSTAEAHYSDAHISETAMTGEETRRRPQLNLAEILEEGGYFSDRRRPSHTEETARQSSRPGEEFTQEEKQNLRRQGFQSDQDSNSDGTQQMNDSSKPDIPQLLLVSSSKDDQSILSELTFDTFLKHGGLREGVLAHSETAVQEQVLPAAGEEDIAQLKERVVKGNGVKNKSLLNKIGKRLKLPKLADLEGINSPFGKRRPSASMRSESSGDEKVLRYPGGREGSHVRFGKMNLSGTESHGGQKVAKVPQKTLCIRVQVQAKSKFRLCTLNPSGIEESDTWATISGTFYQSFYIVGDGSGHLGIADRLVTIHVDS